MSGRPDTDELRHVARFVQADINNGRGDDAADDITAAADHIDALHAAIDRLTEARDTYDAALTEARTYSPAHLAAVESAYHAAVDAVIAEARQ